MKHGVQGPWEIRKAKETDSRAIASFQKLQNRPPRSDSVGSEYFLAETGGNIVGCAAVRARDDLGYLYGLAVAKSWRRQGIGHALTNRRLDWLREAGVNSAFTLVMFWNVRFFRQHGFELTSRKQRDLGSLHDDFTDKWSARSALLVIDLREPQPSLA